MTTTAIATNSTSAATPPMIGSHHTCMADRDDVKQFNVYLPVTLIKRVQHQAVGVAPTTGLS